MRIVAVVQARTGSSRFPGKVLKPLAGATVLGRMLERVQASHALDDIVVATTNETRDQPIIDECRRLDVRCYAGHPTDLLLRHCNAVIGLNADAVVKIPSDCPLIDPGVIDRVVGVVRAAPSEFDFVSNLHSATYPDGNDVEVILADVLAIAEREARQPHEREHTTPFVWDQPERFRVGNVTWETGLNYAMSHRFTIDYPEDYTFIKAVYDALYDVHRAPFSLSEILEFLKGRPDVFLLNRHLAGINWYRHHLRDLRTVGRNETVVFEDV